MQEIYNPRKKRKVEINETNSSSQSSESKVFSNVQIAESKIKNEIKEEDIKDKNETKEDETKEDETKEDETKEEDSLTYSPEDESCKFSKCSGCYPIFQSNQLAHYQDKNGCMWGDWMDE
jgi:hypothetical protein